MAKVYTHVRLERDVLDLLEEVRGHVLEGHEQGQRRLEFDDRDRYSLSQLVELLAEDYLRHADRRRKSRKSCAARRRAARALAAKGDANRYYYYGA